MSKSDRNNPRRSSASESRYSLFEFEQDYPDDAACLEALVIRLYPDGIFCQKCDRITKYHRVRSRTCYECQFCGHQEYPMKGTIFEGSATSLRLWFYAMYLMASTRCGISAKQLERELGVTYKTAWRMFNKIRSLLDQDEDDDSPLFGTVEADETFIGGKAKWKNQARPVGKGRGPVGKTRVHGMAQRAKDGKPGRVVAKVVPNVAERTLLPRIEAKVLPASVVYTDEWRPYDRLESMGYQHSRVNHSQKVYVAGDVHTNTSEGFWSLVKRGIGGVYHSVSTDHLQSYLDEYAFRYNNRDAGGRGMFEAFLSRVQKTAPEAAS